MVINGHTLTVSELGQAYVEYQRICDEEDLEWKIVEMVENEEIEPLSGAEVKELAKRLVYRYRRSIDNNDSIRESEILTAQYLIEEEFE